MQPPLVVLRSTPPAAPTAGRTTLLLTGFGPFPRVPVNATMTLVPRLAAAARRLFPSVRIVSEILPTEWIAAPRRVDSLSGEARPDVILHFGVSSRARGFEIEARGCNTRLRAADASGAHPPELHILAGGSYLLPATFPVDEIVRRLRQQNVPAFRSWSAGTYLCNATLYHSLAANEAGRRIGFVHIPETLAPPRPGGQVLRQLQNRPGCPLTWQQVLIGGIEVIATILDKPSPNVARRELALQLSR